MAGDAMTAAVDSGGKSGGAASGRFDIMAVRLCEK
jgi:hypothetical protein